MYPRPPDALPNGAPAEGSSAKRLFASPREAVLGGLLLLLILFIVVAIAWPVCSGERDDHRVSALSNLKQIGTATIIYASDYDDALPIAELNGRRTALGWAGRITSYVKNDDSFKGLSLRSSPAERRDAKFAYGFSADAPSVTSTQQIVRPQETILLFETAGSTAKPDLDDAWGRRARLSPVGDGTPGGLADSLDPRVSPQVRYALGLLAPTWDAGPRNGGRTFFVFADASAKSLRPAALSAIGAALKFRMR